LRGIVEGTIRVSQSLRILMTADAVGGVWQYSVDLIRGFAEQGAQVLLATLGPRPSLQQKRQIETIPGVELVESSYALEWMQTPWREVDESGEWLLKLQSKFKADVIHLNGYSHAALPWNKPVLVTAHSCVFSWWRAVHGCSPGAEWAEYKRRVTGGLEAAAVVIAPTEFMAQALRDEYGIAARKMKVIHNFSAMKPNPVTQKQPFCMAAGRLWDPAKNLRLLTEIGPELNWPVRVAGSERGPDGTAVKADSIELLGALGHEEFLAQLQGAGIFLHPAYYEPFGLSVLEAANSHCCLVLADIPSLRELWDGSAVFVDPRACDKWVVEVNRLCRDSGLRERYGMQARSRAAAYRGEKTVAEYLTTYRDLPKAKKARGVAA
jgi:glycogen synthase